MGEEGVSASVTEPMRLNPRAKSHGSHALCMYAWTSGAPLSRCCVCICRTPNDTAARAPVLLACAVDSRQHPSTHPFSSPVSLRDSLSRIPTSPTPMLQFLHPSNPVPPRLTGSQFPIREHMLHRDFKHTQPKSGPLAPAEWLLARDIRMPRDGARVLCAAP